MGEISEITFENQVGVFWQRIYFWVFSLYI